MSLLSNLFLVLTCVFVMFVFVISSYSFEDPNIYYNSNDNAIYPSEEEPRKVGWIDPYDMSYDYKSKSYSYNQEYTQDSNKEYAEGTHEKSQQSDNKCEVHLQRLVNSFLRSTSLSKKEEGLFDSSVRLVSSISPRDLKVLKLFAEYGGRKGGAAIGDISDIFHKIFVDNAHYGKKEPSFLDKFTIWLNTVFYKISQSPELTVVSSVMAMLAATWWIFYKTHSYRLAMFSLFLILFFAGFGFTWIRLYEEAEVERYVNIKLHGEVPYHCSGKQMAWYEHMFYRAVGVNCLEFYKLRDVRPIVKISPTDVMAETLSSMVINPATHIGTAYGNFCDNVLSHMSWWLKPIAIPFVFVLPPLIIIVVIALFLNYRLSFSLTGFYLIPSWGGGRQAQCGMRDGDYIEDVSRNTSNLHSLFSKSTGPMFLLSNLPGLQQLISSNLRVENNSESNKEEESKQPETQANDGDLQKEVLEVPLNKSRQLIEYRKCCTTSELSNVKDESDPCCSQSLSKKKDSDKPSAVSSSKDSEANAKKQQLSSCETENVASS